MRQAVVNAILHGEGGHAQPLLGTFAGGAGAILLAIGAANDSGVLAIIGGIVLAIALTATAVLNTWEWSTTSTGDWRNWRRSSAERGELTTSPRPGIYVSIRTPSPTSTRPTRAASSPSRSSAEASTDARSAGSAISRPPDVCGSKSSCSTAASMPAANCT